VRLWHVPNAGGKSKHNLVKNAKGRMYYFLICTSFLFFKVHVVPKPFTCPCGKSLLVECHLLDDQIVRGPITANAKVCVRAGDKHLRYLPRDKRTK
jgi:hypothetical protein